MGNTSVEAAQQPGWMASLDQALVAAKAIAVVGSTKDFIPGHWQGHSETSNWLSLSDFLVRLFTARGYEVVATVDMVGERLPDTEEEVGRRYMRFAKPEMVALLSELGVEPQPPTESFKTDLYLADFEALLSNPIHPIAIIIEHADKMFPTPDQQTEQDRLHSVHLQKAIASAVWAGTGQLKRSNVLALIFPTADQVPADLALGNPDVRVVTIPKPEKDTRLLFWQENVGRFFPYEKRESREEGITQWADRMADYTEGFFIKELAALVRMSQDEGVSVGIRKLEKDLIHAFRFGQRRSPWETRNPAQIVSAGEEGLSAKLRSKVKGQEKAIAKVQSMLLRAQTRIAGWQNPGRPKGVFFFVGPTGVGKTEMAKGLADFLFGSPDAMIRFDMSEYAEEHAVARLIGAPPGYIGYGAGGQLVTAVTEKPFSVLLFDEIEKANPRTLDKFLQILDDGRLTDGRGVTAYFSDTVIIFTSNEGQVHDDPVLNERISEFISKAPYDKDDVSPGDADLTLPLDNEGRETRRFTNLEEYFASAVERYFSIKLKRPELLRRVGFNNIVVFNRIADDVKRSIVESKLKGFGDHLVKLGYASKVVFDPGVCREIAENPAGFGKGGAGGMLNLIGELIEDPVSRVLSTKASAYSKRTMHISLVEGKIQVTSA